MIRIEPSENSNGQTYWTPTFVAGKKTFNMMFGLPTYEEAHAIAVQIIEACRGEEIVRAATRAELTKKRSDAIDEIAKWNPELANSLRDL